MRRPGIEASRNGRRRRSRAWLGVLGAVALVATACGGSTGPGAGDDELRGLQQRPLRDVGSYSLPDAANGDAEFPLRAEPGGLLLVYFGYTKCPDICPGTLAGMKLAIRKLPAADARRVQVAMITVDPGRDTGPVLSKYLKNFFRDAHALRTEDQARLSPIAQAFGVRYEIAVNDEGEEEVGHSALSFAVDDRGRLAVTWPYGFSVAKIAHDLRVLMHDDAR